MTAGEPVAAFEAVYREHAAELKRTAFLITGSDAAAEDAVHEVFVRCVERLDALEHPLSYLRTAVVNECRTQHRRHGHVGPFADDETGRSGARSKDLPVEVVETLDALQRLDERKRAAIVLRYFVDIPEVEIAEVLGCRPATVRSLIRRGVAELREVLL